METLNVDSLQIQKSNKKSWHSDEDAQLIELVNQFGTTGSWTLIASRMENRSGKQCRERYNNHLAPVVKKGNWTKEEDLLIVSLQKELGNHWSKIASHLDGRSDNSVKNRWHLIHRCRPADIPLGTSSTETVLKSERNSYPLAAASKSYYSLPTFSPPGTSTKNNSLDSLDDGHSPHESIHRNLSTSSSSSNIDLMNLYHSHSEHAHFYSSEEKELYSTHINHYHIPNHMMHPINIQMKSMQQQQQISMQMAKAASHDELNTSFTWGSTSDSVSTLLSNNNASPIIDMMGSFNLNDHEPKSNTINKKNSSNAESNQWIMDFIEYESKSDSAIKPEEKLETSFQAIESAPIVDKSKFELNIPKYGDIFDEIDEILVDDDYTSDSSEDEIDESQSDKQTHMENFNNLRKHRRVPSITMSPSMYQTISFFGNSSNNSISMNGNTQLISPASRHLSKHRRCKSKDSFNIHASISSNTMNALMTVNNSNPSSLKSISSKRMSMKDFAPSQSPSQS